VLPPEEQTALARVCRVRHIRRGVTLFAEGDPPEGVFLIVSGRVRLVRASPGAREQVLHEERAGSTLAEVPVFDGVGYVGTAVAVEDSTILFVPKAPLLAAIGRTPRSALAVIRILAARVRKLAAVVEDLSLRAVTERVAGYLVREVERHQQNRVELPETRDELAAHVGTVREQASRALSQLKAAGLIDVRGRAVEVRDLPGLRAAASLK
jgi:CRP-like cAMP-binding protein